jgi:hypothetical protein
MLAHLPSTFRGRRLCASVSQPVSRRGSRFVAFPFGAMSRFRPRLRHGLTKSCRTSRLETRTKESNMRASAPVANRGA